MKRTTTLTLILFATTSFLFITNAQSIFVLQNGNRTQFYSNKSDVTANLQNGDTLYLPPKPIVGDIYFEKNVHVIGAGYHSDTAKVTGISRFTGNIVFSKKSKGSSITGVYTDANIYVRDSSITVTRCNMGELIIQDEAGPISQTNINDCVIRSTISGSNDVVTNTLIERCILYGNIAGGNKTNNMMIKNCTWLYTDNFFCSSLSNLVIQNCIILCNGGYQFFGYGTTSVTLINNLCAVGGISNGTFVMQGNVFGIPESDIFVDKANGDYHIKPTLTQAFTLATDGKQVGIYGTDYPFLVPTYAPRFISINNAENVVNGKLSVKMKVEARDR